MDPQKTESKIHRIDLLRGLAILLVFAFHSWLVLFPGVQNPVYINGVIRVASLGEWVKQFAPPAFGGTGVTLFLIISGFLIHLSTLNRHGGFVGNQFFSKRFWRIVPPYLLVLFVICLLKAPGFYFTSVYGIFDFILHACFLHNLYDPSFFSINASFWSIALEVQLYLVYPAFLFLIRKSGIEKAFFATLALSVVTVVAGSIFGFDGSVSYNNSIPAKWFIWCSGAWLAERYAAGMLIFRNQARYVVLLAGALCLMCKSVEAMRVFNSYAFTLFWLSFFEWFIHSNRIRTSTPLFNFISLTGACSYSLYLIHQPFLSGMISVSDHYLQKISPAIPSVFAAIPPFILLWLISYFLYKTLETKSIQAGVYLRNKQKPIANPA